LDVYLQLEQRLNLPLSRKPRLSPIMGKTKGKTGAVIEGQILQQRLRN
jgi:hypothetical protein